MSIFKKKDDEQPIAIKEATDNIEVTEDLHIKLLTLKEKNNCKNINDTIIEMIELLKEYQDA